MKKIALPLIALAVVLGLASCQPKETKLYVASINDMHANINNFPQLAKLLIKECPFCQNRHINGMAVHNNVKIIGFV